MRWQASSVSVWEVQRRMIAVTGAELVGGAGLVASPRIAAWVEKIVRG